MKKLVIIDTSSFIFRAFFAIRPLHAPDGTPVNAVYGILSMFLKLFSQHNPTHVFLARDSKGGSFRNEIYPLYKANRSEPPEDLVPQFDLIAKLINHLNLPSCILENYEADDIIGSAVVQWKNLFDEILIATSDKDIMQFVGGNVKIVDTMKDKIYDESGVFEKMGVYPHQIVDYLSMLGDTSDNIPGMKGIGAKGAVKLLEEYGSLQGCLDNIDKISNKRIKTSFCEHLEDGKLSKRLIQIKQDLNLGLDPDQTEYRFHSTHELYEFLKSLGFESSIKKLQDIELQSDFALRSDREGSFDIITEVEHLDFESCLVGESHFDSMLLEIEKCEKVAFWAQFDQEDEMLGCSIALDEKKSYFFLFKKNSEQIALFENAESLSSEHLYKLGEVLWEDQRKEIISDHIQSLIAFVFRKSMTFQSRYIDLGQAQFILAPGQKSDLMTLTKHYLGKELMPLDQLMVAKEIPLNQLKDRFNERAISLFQLSRPMLRDLEKMQLLSVYLDMDLPLLKVLAKMEVAGVRLNIPFLEELEETFQQQLDAIVLDIEKLVGQDFNLRSPKQVATILFEKLQLPIVKETKTGPSTDSSVLEYLCSSGVSEVPCQMLKFRELEKLLSTYVKTLPSLVHEKTKRVHTHFTQNVAATGRLSSLNPNLQNIPVRTLNGRLIRKAFVAQNGSVLLSADYSQVELRLLAHFSSDEVMLRAFQNNQDIHIQTASEVLGIPLDQVTKDQRKRAKAVNFGLMYGQSSFGLAGALGISRQEAKEYITNYFIRFSRVKSFLDGLKEKCERDGFVETYFGRRRYIPEIHSKNRNIKAMGERMAINSPIQGTAADIIKKAMLEISQLLEQKKFQSRMLLQVHDELIFEVPESELSEIKILVREKMENIVSMSVPLKVDIGVGVNWYDLG